MAIRTGLATVQGYLLLEGERTDSVDKDGKVFRSEYSPKNNSLVPSLDTLLKNTQCFIEQEREKLNQMKTYQKQPDYN